MVIRINETNQKRYNDFFIEAFNYAMQLKKDSKFVFDTEAEMAAGTFTSLWQYFHYLPQLAKWNPVYYTKLPLDEEMVEIDADSRQLIVPSQLKTCAGIENDHLAESIMFIVDRFHDGMDLVNAQIWIQWTATELVNGEMTKVEKTTVVPANQVDVNYAQNKIRFPWILNNEVTKYPGNIDFSAVFFITGDVEVPDPQPGDAGHTVTKTGVIYRYNTLPSTIKIEPALQKNLSSSPIDVGGLFAAAVRSNNYGPGFYVPKYPHFTQYGVDLNKISDLDYGTDATLGSLQLRAQATAGDHKDGVADDTDASDSTVISYVWKYRAPDTDENKGILFDCGSNITCTIPQGTILTEKEKEFINAYKTSPAEDVTINSAKDGSLTITYSFGTPSLGKEKVKGSKINYFDKYYQMDATGNYSMVTSDVAAEAIETPYETRNLYEQYAYLDLPRDPEKTAEQQPVTGKYFVLAVNSISGTNTTSAKSSVTKSTETTLTSPKDIEFNSTTNVVETLTIPNTKKVTLSPELKIIDGETYKATMKTTTVVPEKNEQTDKYEYDANASDVAASNISYQFTLPDGNNDEEVNKIELSNATPGWYRGTIITRRNREDKDEVTKIWRLINPAEVPELVPTIPGYLELEDDGSIIYAYDVADGSNVTFSVGAEITVTEKVEGVDTQVTKAVDLETYYSQREGFIPELNSDSKSYVWKKFPDGQIVQNASSYSLTVKAKRGEQYECTVTNNLGSSAPATRRILFECQ